MKKYFIHDGKEQKGPFTVEDFKSVSLSPKTMVWFEGLSNWTEAQFIPELKEFIITNPPPFEKKGSESFQNSHNPKSPPYPNEGRNETMSNDSNTGKKGIKVFVFFGLLLGIILLIYWFFPSEEKREKKNPIDYLEIVEVEMREMVPGPYSDKKDPFLKFEGKIINKAKMTSYKDIKIEIEFFTTTNSTYDKDTVIVYQSYPPNDPNVKDSKFSFIHFELDKQLPFEVSHPNTKYRVIEALVFEEDNKE